MSSREKLLALAKKIDTCKRCELYKSANHTVVGEGAASAKVVFVGEAPGYHEDIQGRPFVGNAGKYLSLLLEKVGLRRDDIYITNIIKHRPPENRDPLPAEIAACSLWLEEQLTQLSPKIIVTLGRWSLNFFSPTKKISEVHGLPFRTQDKVILPMYHPAAALRNTRIGSSLEEDFLNNKHLLLNPETAEKIEGSFEEGGQGSLF